MKVYPACQHADCGSFRQEVAKRQKKRLLLGVLRILDALYGVNDMDLTTLTLREYTSGFLQDTGRVSASSHSNGTSRATLRRCRTREHGVALMTVGHAIEYLVDSRLIKQQDTTSAELEALSILLNANLSVYNEGTEIRPIGSRLRQWFRGGGLSKSGAVNASA